MAQILDKQGLQHYANKMCNADNRKVGSKNLPTALNEIDIAIDGFKTLFETEYGTPVNMELENNENVFSIGTGINIDKRSDVENSFTDVELSGNSLVNLCPQTYNFTTVTTKGEAILDGLDVTYNSPTYRIKAFTLTQPLKPNTTYTAIVNILSLVNSGAVASYVKYSDGEAVYNQFSATQLGLNIKKFTTSNKIATELAYYLHEGECSAKISGVIILEGDWTNKPIPQYFEGLKSIGEKEDGNHKISISSVGKNLWDGTFEIGSIDTTNGKDIANGVNRKRSMYIPIKGGKTISVNQFDYIDDSHKIFVHQYDENKNAVLRSPALYVTVTSSITFSLENSTRFIRFRTENERDLKPNSVQIKYGESSTSYEPHKSDKKEILLN